MFLEFDFRGGASLKITPIFTYDFHPSQDPGGTHGTLWGLRQIKKLHKTKSDQRLILAGPLL